jgi:hypothetical protein
LKTVVFGTTLQYTTTTTTTTTTLFSSVMNVKIEMV